jgi:hypothetical protein
MRTKKERQNGLITCRVTRGLKREEEEGFSAPVNVSAI